MPYPWPSLGAFRFTREETPIYGTDIGWQATPSYSRQRPLGSTVDVITTLSIGSYERSFEVFLSQERFDAFFTLLNSSALFTDWKRPVPDSRQAFLSEVSRVEQAGYGRKPNGLYKPKIRTRVVLVSA